MIIQNENNLEQFELGDKLKNIGKPNLPNYRGRATLADLLSAFSSKNQSSEFVNQEYRKSVVQNQGFGEGTSSFIQDGMLLFVEPSQISFTKKKGWQVEVDPKNRLKIELPVPPRPDHNWIVEFDNTSYLPSKLGSREQAQENFGADASRFWYINSGLRQVFVVYGSRISNCGPFAINATYLPNARIPIVGYRTFKRI